MQMLTYEIREIMYIFETQTVMSL